MKKKRYNSPECEVMEIQAIELMASTTNYKISTSQSSDDAPSISDGGDTQSDVDYTPW